MPPTIYDAEMNPPLWSSMMRRLCATTVRRYDNDRSPTVLPRQDGGGVIRKYVILLKDHMFLELNSQQINDLGYITNHFGYDLPKNSVVEKLQSDEPWR